MKILCTSDWRSADPSCVADLVEEHRPDIVLHGGNWQGKTISKKEMGKMKEAVDRISEVAPIFGIMGALDTDKIGLSRIKKNIELVKYLDAEILLVPHAVSCEMMDMAIPYIFDSMNRECIRIVVQHGIPLDIESSTGSDIGRFVQTTLAWDVCVIGGCAVAQVTGGGAIVPGTIEKTTSEIYLPYAPTKGCWMWEDRKITFLPYHRDSVGASQATDELYNA